MDSEQENKCGLVFLCFVVYYPPTMAKIRSAKKANRVAKRRAIFNARRKRSMKGSVRAVADATKVRQGDTAALLSKTYSEIDKAVKRGIIKKNTAARMKSRLTKQISKVS